MKSGLPPHDDCQKPGSLAVATHAEPRFHPGVNERVPTGANRPELRAWDRTTDPAVPRPAAGDTLRGMCRSIRQLRRAEDAGPATTGEARAAALQYVRKVSGFREPSARNADAFRDAVEEIAAITQRLLTAVGTPVADGPDPFADPVTRRAIIEAREAAGNIRLRTRNPRPTRPSGDPA